MALAQLLISYQVWYKAIQAITKNMSPAKTIPKTAQNSKPPLDADFSHLRFILHIRISHISGNVSIVIVGEFGNQ